MSDESEIIDKVQSAATAIGIYLSERFWRDKSIADDFGELVNVYIGNAVHLWVGHTYVGIQKREQIRNAFQEFYTKLMNLLLTIKVNPADVTEEEVSFANALLYRGTAYRYLGYGDFRKRNKAPIEPNYNDIYVSWSTKKELTSYMREKLHGTKTLLTAKISKDYGINLEFFHFVQQENEKEVVYPTKKESITSIEYIE